MTVGYKNLFLLSLLLRFSFDVLTEKRDCSLLLTKSLLAVYGNRGEYGGGVEGVAPPPLW